MTISDEATGFSRVAVTNEEGQYAFADVQPATYTVRAELDGFAVFERQGVELSVQRFLVLDIRLELASVRESITVTSASPNELLYCIYEVDPLTCARCGARMKILAFIIDPAHPTDPRPPRTESPPPSSTELSRAP